MTARPYHHGDLRNALLAAGREALRTTPPDQLSLRELARQVGVSANAPYRHFADRDALVAALAVDGYRSLAREIAGAAGATPVAAIASAYRAFARRETGLFRMMFAPHTSLGSDREDALQELFAEIVARLGRTGQHDPEASLRAAAGLWMALHGATLFTLDGTLDWLDGWIRPSGTALASAVVAGLTGGDDV